ncbi:MAG: LytR/AlgR family response regulator transcription factor [Acidobacteriota bacterium]
MNRLRLLIVDDEPLIRFGIRNDLAGLQSIDVGGESGSVAEAVDAIRSNEFDLVLLDVQLPDGTGFDVVREVGPAQMPAVVFVTAYDKYAIQAFEINAVDYLLKPFDESRLKASIERARERLARPSVLIRQLESLIEARENQWPKTLVVRNGERFDFVPVESIDWIESANNYTLLHCRVDNYVFDENLTGLERRLDPGKFLRVHRCHMVNVTRITAVHSIAGGVFELELHSGARIRTGRQYSEGLRRLLKSGR